MVDDVKCVYEKALTPVERPRITSSAKMRMKKYDLEKVKQELAEERECRNALRLRNISPYFKSELAAGYSNLQVRILQTWMADGGNSDYGSILIICEEVHAVIRSFSFKGFVQIYDYITTANCI